ncbi:MAG TPA: hypothetical protein VIO94_08945, partial [Phenylobacterium sp.]
EARLELTVDRFAECAAEPRPDPEFGCFSYEPPDANGAVRIHFHNRDSADGTGPLTQAKAPARMAELQAMFAHVETVHPQARAVRGGSWLYNLEAYRRLFPPAYGASRRAPERVSLSGTSSWGQLLDHTEAVKPAVRDAFLARLPELDPAAPWRVFPLPALRTQAPLALFGPFYARAF